MPILIFLVTVVAGAAIRPYRARAPRRTRSTTVADAAITDRGRIRQARFERRANVHPADQIEVPREAAAGIVATVIAERGPGSLEDEARLTKAVARHLDTDAAEAAEIAALARWLADRGAPDEMRRRLVRRLGALAGAAALPDTLAGMHGLCGPGDADEPAGPVADAERDLRRRLA